ncbi:MAG: hypothetical protein KY394_02225 [Actinobacteria bacterium]|nr:hypothetical protein [Actinomycetota bacterium]
MRKICLIVSMIALAACSGTAASGALEELEAARQRWSAAGLDDYRFTFQDDCGECLPSSRLPREVVVRDGEASAPGQPTVDSLFDAVEKALADGSSVDVAYHPVLGYPEYIWIDREARVRDGGTHWLIHELAGP